jgi:hypothetical protein
MAKKNEKLSKSKLIAEIDETLQALNLLRSALEGDPTRKQEDLENYRNQFYGLVNKGKQK